MKKILVTEDSPGWQRFHKEALREIFGDEIKIDSAFNAREGYDKAYNSMSQPYDLIISDLQMESDFEPKFAGEWFVEQVKMLDKYYRTPIIIISACYNIKSVAESLGVHALPKSIAANDMMTYKFKITELLNL